MLVILIQQTFVEHKPDRAHKMRKRMRYWEKYSAIRTV
ncbi:hypothetical protein CIPAW_03G066300 [Carya illinoinensis]|uniref:Uncharacterized protein n=1 Tax=Carya illinoinensis TaxID=32201 RepID=A0A8T1QXM7_CARIL|nr:hypothetical protein CIPAW_03G066300 [Carya illinoinensis]